MRIPKLRKHSSGQGRVTLGGRVHYCGKYGTRQCRDNYNRLIGEYIAGGGIVITDEAKSDLTISEMMLAYLKWATNHYGKQSGELDRIKRIIKAVRKRYGSTAAKSYGYQQFEAVRMSLVDDGVGRKYANESMNRLIRIFRWGASRGLIEPSVPQALSMIEPIKKGRTTAPEPRKVLPVDPSDVERTLPALPKLVADMVRVQSLIGCRPGEVCKLTPSMIDRTGDVWEVNLEQHKTAWKGKDRTLYVGPRAQAILQEYILRMPDEYCFSPIESERQRRAERTAARVTPLSCGTKSGDVKTRKPKRTPGECYTTASYRRAIHRACDLVFLPPEPLEGEELDAWQSKHRWSPNQLRHTFGTNVRRTEGVEAARVLLGHSDIATTEIYAEADRTKAIEAARKVG